MAGPAISHTSFLIDPTGAVILAIGASIPLPFSPPPRFHGCVFGSLQHANLSGRGHGTRSARPDPCGEINVPEVARVLMMQGAEVIVHSTNSPRRPAQEAAKIVRALKTWSTSSARTWPEASDFVGRLVPGGAPISSTISPDIGHRGWSRETIAVSALIGH